MTLRRSALLVASAILFTVAAASAQSPRPRTPKELETDASFEREVAAESAEAAEAFARGNALREEGDFVGAGAAYDEAARLAPKSSHPVRRACGALDAQEKYAEAVAKCREALARDDRPLNRAALADSLFLQGRDSDAAEAHELARTAFHRDSTGDDFIAVTYCGSAVRRGDLASMTAGLERLRKVAPGAPVTHYFAGIAHAMQGEWSDAEREMDAAVVAGMPADEGERMKGLFRESQPFYVRYGRHAGAFGVGWLATLVSLVLGGFALSALTMRSARSLPAEKTGRPHGVQAFIRRAYAFFLWVACAFYYVSIPLVLAFVVLATLAVVYGALVVGHIPVKLLVILGIVAATTVWAILKSLFVRSTDEDPGDRLDLDTHTRLRDVLHEVAEKVGTRPVDAVFLTTATELAVFERGSALSRVRGRSAERCLVLGLGVLQDMRLIDFKAVLAHEYGHFQNADTAGGGFALAVRRSLIRSIVAMAESGVATWYNPAWWFMRGFFALFLRVSQGASRLQEILADRWAAFSYGPAAFESGLRHAIAASVVFDMRTDAVLREAVEEKRGFHNLYTAQPTKPLDDEEVSTAIEASISREASAYDSHPSPTERFALVHRLVDTPAAVDDGTKAIDLLEDGEALQLARTREICARVAAETGVKVLLDPTAKSDD
jgi:Zn-dependent protease with chaperone function